MSKKNKVEIFAQVARDKDRGIYLYPVDGVVTKCEAFGYWEIPDSIKLEDNSFPMVKWKDKEPTKVKVTIEVMV